MATTRLTSSTATPKRHNNADTYAYFGEPVYTYSLKEGINDGYLTPFKVKQIATTIDDYTYTPDDAVVEGEVVQGKRYVEGDFNRVIGIPEREAENCDLFDVLACVAFALEPLTREALAGAARAAAAAEFTDKQQAFINFVLAQYVNQGVAGLNQDKLSPLLRLRYKALNDAFAELGQPEQVRQVFIGFQRHLYQPPGVDGPAG